MGRLADALFTNTQQNVLGLMYVQPKKSFYINEILRLTGMGVATIKRELERMETAGILSMTRIGNQHHYQANPGCPIYEELLSIAAKTFGVADILETALEPIKASIQYAFVYGSMAKGKERAESDIDLMVVGDNLNYGDMMELLIPIESKLGRPINPTIYSRSDFQKELKEKSHFLVRVLEQKKMMVMGSENDIRES